MLRHLCALGFFNSLYSRYLLFYRIYVTWDLRELPRDSSLNIARDCKIS